jgi:hypothetical protein
MKDIDLSSPVDVGQVGAYFNPCVHFDCVFVVSFFSIYFCASVTTCSSFSWQIATYKVRVNHDSKI